MLLDPDQLHELIDVIGALKPGCRVGHVVPAQIVEQQPGCPAGVITPGLEHYPYLRPDKEEQREASAASLMVGIFILFLLTIGGFAFIALWPAMHFSGQ